ncbi:MAG: hypothetical protein JWM99_4005 [Verrucomicrobiales bacterium]|nr:hypothetical protein [Verrucomicrobiales bacterium]
MSSFAEIEAALPSLSTSELQRLEQTLLHLYRKRNVPIIYDDSYGLWTEDDQMAAVGEALVLLDQPAPRKDHP